MTEKTALYSLSISARATLDMHSLNNEGGEGNQIQTRMVNIVGADGRLVHDGEGVLHLGLAGTPNLSRPLQFSICNL